MTNRLIELKAFVEYLKDELGFNFDVTSFNHRIRLQKYVFIAMSLGWDIDYPYNLYIRGPYSPDLAKDYYNLESIIISQEEQRKCLASLPKSEFGQIIQGKKVAWLEVATTMISLHSGIRDKVGKENIDSLVLGRTKDIKSEYDSDGFIDEIFCHLKQNKLLDSS